MAKDCRAHGTMRWRSLALACSATMILASCDAQPPAKPATQDSAALNTPADVQGAVDTPRIPNEITENGVEVTDFTPQQDSALYVTMTIEKMDPNGTGYDITPAVAASPLAGKEFRIPSDMKARWGLIDIKQDPSGSIIFTHRIGTSGTTYSIRQYDCASDKVRYVATGETIAEMRSSKADARMSDIQGHSIAYYLGRLACTNLGG